jgi:acetyltransferase
MSTYNLDKIYKPKRIAVVGASDNPDSIGGAILKNLQQGGYAGGIIPVNPKYKRIGGLTVLPSLADCSGDADLAIIATPIATVPDLIPICARVGITAAIVISAGGKESGEKGRAIESRIKVQADLHKIRIIGPNCLGVISTGLHLNTTFAADMPLKGKLAFVSQSGAICTSILDLAFKERIGFSYFVSLGSMVDVDFGDMIDYLGYEAGVSSILLYIESLTNIRKFMSAARSVAKTKPIIALKAGRSNAGARAAASHTGAMAGEDDVYDAAFKRAGIIRVDTIQELFDCAELIAKQPLPRGSRFGIISNGGGPAVMAADAVAACGSEPESLTPDTVETLSQHLPPFWSRSNPIDILGDATAERYEKTINACIASKNFDGLMTMFVPQAIAKPEHVADSLSSANQTKKIPLIGCWMGGRDVAAAVDRLNLSGIPTYDTPERAVRAFFYMVQYVRNLELSNQIPQRLPRQLTFDTSQARQLIENGLKQDSDFLTEVDSKALLACYGLPVSQTKVAASSAQAAKIAEEIGFPLALKIVSPDITHKAEVNGIKLDIRSLEEVVSAYDEIISSATTHRPVARIEGIAIQPYIHKADYELLLGAKRDANFGPVLVFGLGGVFTEVIKDRSIGLPPMNRLLARRMMQETKAYRLLSGYRNHPPADMDLLEEMLIRLSQLLIDFPEILEIDLNPVVVKNGVPVAVDARIALNSSSVSSPMHLVVSPYPGQYESREKTKDGVELLVRPIQPDDGSLFSGLFARLSAASIYFRFCRCIKILSPEMLARMTQIDYDREMALVAIAMEQSQETMIGAARIINEPDGRQAEFAVMIADDWQGKGVGALLLQKLIVVGRQRGLETIWGYVLQENKSMLRLGKKIGFSSRFDIDVEMVVLTIDLRITL